ncbi:hypothetical protein [Streptomyces acidiscabies]|uniref:Uncharacterized protein n=1 Tax=Streptomyces acidiscabies TaxID=42234 RepID=A0AAP6EMX3_9ACTN|nr:hypothetical protein [Streptomyces acidiscabies]MBP5936699.1 hypothetical protein [Streptomyces sp. LBUM 1476]MBZ3915304.1 hypothetical protein [Streptomyces acidiscabies]MDX2967416.1 hypothetical protein [Streptomyces acidiscabies]MDX3026053.1 hypothetical protein [Streptomyces acidiscabies]MDX3797028.1 hypothetical protein [Streptomyces acidiscabies]
MKRDDVQNLYRDVTGPLTARGLTCTVEYGLSDWVVHAELPDGSYLFIAPPQEPPGDHPPGRPEAWLASWNRDASPAHRLLYDSAPGGPTQPSAATSSRFCARWTRTSTASASRPAPRTSPDPPTRRRLLHSAPPRPARAAESWNHP